MTDTATHRPNATDMMAAVRACLSECHDSLAEEGQETIADLLETAASALELVVRLLELAAPNAEDNEPGTGEALERASELTADTHRHIVTGMFLAAGAHAITKSARRHH